MASYRTGEGQSVPLASSESSDYDQHGKAEKTFEYHGSLSGL